MPPGVLQWDAAGNNKAWLSAEAVRREWADDVPCSQDPTQGERCGKCSPSSPSLIGDSATRSVKATSWPAIYSASRTERPSLPLWLRPPTTEPRSSPWPSCSALTRISPAPTPGETRPPRPGLLPHARRVGLRTVQHLGIHHGRGTDQLNSFRRAAGAGAERPPPKPRAHDRECVRGQ